jgi:tripartite-type tricarboxylate transporter receptor subunit TctC
MEAAELEVPARTPAMIVEPINRLPHQTLDEPALIERLAKIGFFTDGAGTLAQPEAFVKAQYQAWGKINPAIGIKPD